MIYRGLVVACIVLLGGCKPGSSVIPGSAHPIEAFGALAEGRTEHAVFVADDSVVVAGGRGEFDPIASVERLDLASGTWSRIGELPFPLAGPCTGSLGGHLVVAGGRDSTEAPSDAFFGSSDGGETWESLGALPAVHGDPGCATLDGRLYVVGGEDADGTPTDRVSIIDLEALSVEAGPNLRNARHFHTTMATPDGRILVASGDGDPGLLEKGELLIPGETDWEETSSLRTPRRYGVPIVWRGRACVAGGRGQGFLESIECLDPNRLTWDVAGRMDDTRAEASVLVVEDDLVVVGGGLPVRQRDAIIASDILVGEGVEGEWEPVARLRNGRMGATTTHLGDGRYLVVGGRSSRGRPVREVEIFEL